MKLPFHSSSRVRLLVLISFLCVCFLPGCGKIRSWYTPKQGDNPHSVTIAWSAGTTPVAGYNVYRASPPDGFVKLTVRVISDTQYTDKTVQAGRTYSYSVTAVDFKGVESKPSAIATVTVPTTVSGSVSIPVAPPAKQ